ncbi:MAG: hypothetical protein A2169_02665 [Deltaproteobacteria bacterium RBG_13_47_9]|nr:MAG: hypothetical protein A2169_02665 [Deltaproteobacteria bacterium RBG_13_47_9]
MKESKIKVNKKEDRFFSTLFDLFRSLKLTIFLLILLAILSIIGTLIAQNASRAEYIQRYGMGIYEVLRFFNLLDMYHSWWFSSILLLLVINLIACSIHRFPGVWSQTFRKSNSEGLDDSMLKILPYVEKVQISTGCGATTEKDIRTHLKKRFRNPKRIETESAITFFSERGKFSRLGFFITHLSLLIILIGGLLGSIYGFRGFVQILEGETVNQIFLRAKDESVPKPIDFSVRCDDFTISYYDLPGKKEKHVKEYVSILTILENGKEALQQTIKVNHPLHYKGLVFYQSSYGAIHDLLIGIQWRGKKEKTIFHVLEGNTVPIPDTNIFIRLLKFEHQVHNFGEGVQTLLLRPDQEPQPLWLFRNFPKFDEKRNDEFVLTIEEVNEKEYTGLQVTKDPGVWVVWAGCGLMIFGFIVSFFFSHQRVWVRIPKSPDGEIVLAGSTNKNRLGFEKTFDRLVKGVRSKI